MPTSPPQVFPLPTHAYLQKPLNIHLQRADRVPAPPEHFSLAELLYSPQAKRIGKEDARLPQLELLKHSRVQDTKDADDGLCATDAQMDRGGVAGEEGWVCVVLWAC